MSRANSSSPSCQPGSRSLSSSAPCLLSLEEEAWSPNPTTSYEEFDDVEDKTSYKAMLTRDERRFKKANQDGNLIATKEEFTAFLHPEEFDYMKEVVVQTVVMPSTAHVRKACCGMSPAPPPCRKIVDRIDGDKDGFITHVELHSWIRHRQQRYIDENVMKHWKEYDLNRDDYISWDEYKNTTYGYYLDKNWETVEDIDKNGDGLINVNEYIGDMFTPDEGEAEPDWVQKERQQFSEFRDLNKDGSLDTSEVAHWILPGEVDHADTEAKHLIYETDKDKDEKLTKEEILANWNMFVGSQATNYGEDLTKKHDEL
nr:PREDICTED: reticulocalbin-1-like [Lepisosteus oculatus]